MQKILHNYRKKILGSNLRAAVATIDPDDLHKEIVRFVSKDSRTILQGLGILPQVFRCVRPACEDGEFCFVGLDEPQAFQQFFRQAGHRGGWV